MDSNHVESQGPDLITLEQQAVTVRSDMTSIQIVDQPSYNKAVEARVAAVAWLKKAEEFFDPSIADAHALHKKLIGQKKAVCGPVDDTIKAINSELVRYDNEQERLRREEQRRLDEEAARLAREQILEDAVHAETMGADEETIAAVLEQPVAVTAPVVAAPTYQKSAAVTYRETWSGECTNLLETVKAAAKGNKTALGLLQINQPALNAMARAMKQTLADAVPGCRAVSQKQVATGRG